MAAEVREGARRGGALQRGLADTFRGFGFPGADELGNMFQFKRDFEAEYVGARDLEVARSLDPELKDFDAWLAENASRVPIA